MGSGNSTKAKDKMDRGLRFLSVQFGRIRTVAELQAIFKHNQYKLGEVVGSLACAQCSEFRVKYYCESGLTLCEKCKRHQSDKKKYPISLLQMDLLEIAEQHCKELRVKEACLTNISQIRAAVSSQQGRINAEFDKIKKSFQDMRRQLNQNLEREFISRQQYWIEPYRELTVSKQQLLEQYYTGSLSQDSLKTYFQKVRLLTPLLPKLTVESLQADSQNAPTYERFKVLQKMFQLLTTQGGSEAPLWELMEQFVRFQGQVSSGDNPEILRDVKNAIMSVISLSFSTEKCKNADLRFEDSVQEAFSSATSNLLVKLGRSKLQVQGKINSLNGMLNQQLISRRVSAIAKESIQVWDKLANICEADDPFQLSLLSTLPVSRDKVSLLKTIFNNEGINISSFKVAFDARAKQYSALEYRKACLGLKKYVVLVSACGKTFGGYAGNAAGVESGRSLDRSAFLFQLERGKVFRVDPSARESLYFGEGSGPSFGAGQYLDLYLSDNCHLNSFSYSYLGKGFKAMPGDCLLPERYFRVDNYIVLVKP